MPCGKSGTIVVKLEQDLKLAFDARLRAAKVSKKAWLTERVLAYLEGEQLGLPLTAATELDSRTFPPARPAQAQIHASRRTKQGRS